MPGHQTVFTVPCVTAEMSAGRVQQTQPLLSARLETFGVHTPKVLVEN